jgi:hypothetical protein
MSTKESGLNRNQINETFDAVNHPKHYKSHPSGIECIEVTRHMNFNLGNAIKYLWRTDHKNGVEDLRKAIWYIEDEIKKRVKDQNTGVLA